MATTTKKRGKAASRPAAAKKKAATAMPTAGVGAAVLDPRSGRFVHSDELMNGADSPAMPAPTAAEYTA